MSLLTIEEIRRSINDHSPKRYAVGKSTRQAAVSVVLRRGQGDTQALFILRATKEGDPWSGHMAFPGGHLEAGDESLRHAAERETLEEIGLDLALTSDFIGQLDAIQANPRDSNLDMVVTPFAYVLKNDEVSFQPNYEVADVLWGSLNDMHSGHSHTMGEFVISGETVKYPGYGVGREIVWGLTYRMLDQFFAMLDPAWEER